METDALLQGKKSAALLGLGRSNLALADFLLRRGFSVTARDRRPFSALPAEAAALAARGVSFVCGDDYLHDLSEDILFRTPVLRPDLPEIAAAVTRGALLSSESALFSRLTRARLLGVTGSDGKTTTATLAGLLLRAGTEARIEVGGNIGRPLLSLAEGLAPTDVAVMELSSFQLMTPGRAPMRAVITNLTENHLNWHRGMDEYRAAKQNILAPHTTAVLNADDAGSTAFLSAHRGALVLFSVEKTHGALRARYPAAHTVTAEDGAVKIDGETVGAVKDILLPGRHNLENYLAALGLVYPFLSDPAAAFAEVAGHFCGVAHRLELVGEVAGVRYYNSSIDSTPSRTAATLDALGGRPIVLCGGQDKNLSFAPLREALCRHARAVVLFGEAREKIADALGDCPFPVKKTSSLRQAVRVARGMAVAGDRVLLSPACTSFDEFCDFEERGNCFRTWIQND